MLWLLILLLHHNYYYRWWYLPPLVAPHKQIEVQKTTKHDCVPIYLHAYLFITQMHSICILSLKTLTLCLRV